MLKIWARTGLDVALTATGKVFCITHTQHCFVKRKWARTGFGYACDMSEGLFSRIQLKDNRDLKLE